MKLTILLLALAVLTLFGMALVAGQRQAADVLTMSDDALLLAIENCDMWHEDAGIYHAEVARRAAAAI